MTGAASGIGRAVAERFAAEGAHLVLTDTAGDALRETARAIAAACKDPDRVRALEADAARAEDAAAAVNEAVLEFGGLDVLVCNAGFVEAGPIDRISEASWDRHFEVNVKGTYLAVREAVPVMKAQGRGAIVLNASKGAFAPTVDNAAYASSKAAVAALARNLATELGPHGIRVNCFNADFVDTALMRRLVEQRAALKGIAVAAQLEEYRRRNLLGVGPIPASAVAEVGAVPRFAALSLHHRRRDPDRRRHQRGDAALGAPPGAHLPRPNSRLAGALRLPRMSFGSTGVTISWRFHFCP